MAYNIFGDEKYAQRCYAELEGACNFKDWNPSHFLDTAEMSTAFALGYNWLYHWMNDEQRAFLRKNMIEKGLTQVMEDYEDKTPDSAKDSPTDWGEVGASNASFRNTWDESGIVTALHAGENVYKYHGHYDLGTFYLESNGARFFTDLGNENYELENRLYSYRIRAEVLL